MLQQTTQLQEISFLPLNKVIDTPHISLRPIHEHFASFVHREYTANIARCMYREPCNTFLETKLRIQEDIEKMKEQKMSSFVICENSTGNPCGCALLTHKKRNPKIGIWIAKDYQQKGYGTGAVWALKTYAKQNLPPHQYITVLVSRQNFPAIALLGKLGAELRPHITYKANEAGHNGALLTYRLYH